MSIWVFSVSLGLITIIIGSKMFELKRGKRFFVSQKLLEADEAVIPKVTAFYHFFTERGKRTLISYLSHVTDAVVKGIVRFSHMVEEKSKALKDSSRGKYVLKNGDTPRSEFLRTIIEHRNEERNKESGVEENDTSGTLK
jgi:hypothetical protein